MTHYERLDQIRAIARERALHGNCSDLAADLIEDLAAIMQAQIAEDTRKAEDPPLTGEIVSQAYKLTDWANPVQPVSRAQPSDA